MSRHTIAALAMGTALFARADGAGPTVPGSAERSPAPAYTNRLIDSGNPYLLLHAHNPVDWYP
ncbi:MAG TPA: hypothetical protein VMS64_40675, partial [Candidatus Methylomirabilis sp.]|nr:hypothetical protein [Candidatus Methylomirabilis sp.]